MGYKVMYPQVGKRKCRNLRKPPPKAAITALLGIVLALILTVWQGGLSWLLPGDPEVTGDALQTMLDSLSDGERLGDAVVTFCREVVAGGR